MTIDTVESKSRASTVVRTHTLSSKRPGERKSTSVSHAVSSAREIEPNFKPNLGLDFKKVKSLLDIKDIESLFFKVQFVLEHCDKERFKKLRSGELSLT